ncbi:hypothetical protein RZS08_64585, partial [Arthrospira platensis SPKY1]|nr:hypothetical protein [Arthrospira platensis SPKY1]
LACLELHTFSSLNPAFLPEYAHALDPADQAAVFYTPHTLEMKRLPPLNTAQVQAAFQRQDLRVFDRADALEKWLDDQDWEGKVLLWMSSGTFGGLDLKAF